MSQRTFDLNKIRVASPCPATWETMTGDDRSRFCSQCRKHVFNLSQMKAVEVSALIAAKEGKVCVRLFRRADGTVLTADCPVGWRALRQRATRIITAAASVAFALVATLACRKEAPKVNNGTVESPVEVRGEAVMGDICQPSPIPAEPANMGLVALPEQTSTSPTQDPSTDR